MRFTEELIHPRIYRMLSRVHGEASCFSLSLIMIVIGGAILGGVLSSVTGGLIDPGTVVLLTIIMSVIIAYGLRVIRLRRDFSTEEIRGVLPALKLDDVGTAYVEALIALGENPALTEEAARQIARELRDLLETYDNLERQAEDLRELMGTATQEELEKLQSRLAKTTDRQARAAFEESLSLLQRRLQNSQALAIYVQRMEAHRELILQTMKSLRESLTRLKLSPDYPTELNVDEIYQSLREVQQEAIAIENAAQEVLQMGR